jgi:hypothetical protein
LLILLVGPGGGNRQAQTRRQDRERSRHSLLATDTDCVLKATVLPILSSFVVFRLTWRGQHQCA